MADSMGDSIINESLANLVATIEAVAVGDISSDMDNEHDTQIVTAEMLDGAVLHLSDGQSINVVQMSGSLADMVQVEAELGDHLSTMDEMCAIDIDTEEQKHILSETGAHVVVNTENEMEHVQMEHESEGKPVVLPTVPFSFPGQTFDVKCQKLILNVWDFFRRLKKNPDILDEIRTPQERAAAALHISAATIGKIGKHFRSTGKLHTPGRRRKRAKPVVDSVNADQEQIIRDIINEYKESRVTPTLPLLLNEVRDRINFQGGCTSFRRILHRMGFKGITAKLQAAQHATPSASKTKPVSSSSLRTPQQATAKPRRSIEAPKTVSIDHGYLSIPITTPVTSPTKKMSFRTVAPSASPAISFPTKEEPSFTTTKLSSSLLASLFGNNFLQLGSSAKAEPITISQQAAAALASATSRTGEAPPTIHVLQPDNTLQQIQIVYTT